MEFITKPDVEIRRKCELIDCNDVLGCCGPHKVDIRLHENHAIIAWNQNGYTPPFGDRIKIKRHPFTWFGFKKIESYHTRIQKAIDIMQCRCDKLDVVEIEKAGCSLNEITTSQNDDNMTAWWLIHRENVDDIKKKLNELIDSTSEAPVLSAKDALMILETGLHQSSVGPWDM